MEDCAQPASFTPSIPNQSALRSSSVEVLWAGGEMGKAVGFLTTRRVSVFMAQAVEDFVRILCCPALLSFSLSPL